MFYVIEIHPNGNAKVLMDWDGESCSYKLRTFAALEEAVEYAAGLDNVSQFGGDRYQIVEVKARVFNWLTRHAEIGRLEDGFWHLDYRHKELKTKPTGQSR